MHRSKVIHILLAAVVLLTAFAPRAAAQFKSEPFSNGFGDEEDVSPADSSAAMFSLKDYFAALSHKRELDLPRLAGGSAVFIGGQQIYNRQYWKLPVIYGGLGATVGGGFYFRNKYNTSLEAYNSAFSADPNTTVTVDDKSRMISNIMFAGGALIYWGTLLDGVISFPTDKPHDANKAMLYSVLCPGLGQVYNGEAWKVPLYWGFLLGAGHYLDVNQTNYKRFKRIHNEATNPDGGYTGSISGETALYYRDIYRRYRDYSVLAVAAFYLIQIIDANVFSYMQDFEVNDDISMQVKPALLTPDTQFAFSGSGSAVLGVSLGLRF